MFLLLRLRIYRNF